MLWGLCHRRANACGGDPSWAALAGLLCLLGSCQAPTGSAVVSVRTLREALPLPVRPLARAEVSGRPLPADIATPLTARLWLIELHTRDDWRRLRAFAPAIGPCPDLRRGAVFGLLLRCGQPLSGRWPLHLTAARVVDGAALLEGRVSGGSFLLDTTGHLTLVQVPGAQQTLVVDLGDQRFYPQVVSD